MLLPKSISCFPQKIYHPLSVNARLSDEMCYSNRTQGITTAANFNVRLNVESLGMPSEHTVASYYFHYIMRSHSDLWPGLRLCIVHQQPFRYGRKTGTAHVKTGVQETTSFISHICGTNSATNVNAVSFPCITSPSAAFS